MKAGLESNIVNKSLRWLNSLPNAKFLKRHGNAYTEAGNPDIEGSIKIEHAGRIFGQKYEIEIKKPGEKPDGMQLKRIQQWQEAGAVAFWTDNFEDLRRKVLESL